MEKKVPYWWHRLYTSYTGKFDYKYIPEYIYSIKIEPRYNNRISVLPLENKNMLSSLFSNVKGVTLPITYINRINGNFYDKNMNAIDKEMAVKIIKDVSQKEIKLVIKKSVDSNSGRELKF